MTPALRLLYAPYVAKAYLMGAAVGWTVATGAASARDALDALVAKFPLLADAAASYAAEMMQAAEAEHVAQQEARGNLTAARLERERAHAAAAEPCAECGYNDCPAKKVRSN